MTARTISISMSSCLSSSNEALGDRTPTIVLTGFGSIEKAISVVHDLKAFWFLEKPVQPALLTVSSPSFCPSCGIG
jgi:FixJ family two-component response regulator